MTIVSKEYEDVLDRLDVLRQGIDTETGLRQEQNIITNQKPGLPCLVTLADSITGDEYVGFLVDPMVSNALYEAFCEARTPEIFTKLFVPW